MFDAINGDISRNVWHFHPNYSNIANYTFPYRTKCDVEVHKLSASAEKVPLSGSAFLSRWHATQGERIWCNLGTVQGKLQLHNCRPRLCYSADVAAFAAHKSQFRLTERRKLQLLSLEWHHQRVYWGERHFLTASGQVRNSCVRFAYLIAGKHWKVLSKFSTEFRSSIGTRVLAHLLCFESHKHNTP